MQDERWIRKVVSIEECLHWVGDRLLCRVRLDCGHVAEAFEDQETAHCPRCAEAEGQMDLFGPRPWDQEPAA